MTPELHIAVGLLYNERGEVLIAQRRPEADQGGLWEFPGGKIEPGEDCAAALVRELAEELGIEVRDQRPVLKVRHAYPDRSVCLDCRRVIQWEGAPYGREGQPLRWVAPEHLDTYRFPAADRPIIRALQLPPLYLISPEPGDDLDAFLNTLEECLIAGLRLFQLRAKHQGRRWRDLTRLTAWMCERYAARLVLNASPEEAERLGAHGVHLTAARLLALTRRPLPDALLVGASCHNAVELKQARAVGADFATLGPVLPTRTHPGAPSLGWEGFGTLQRAAELPVYALGGLDPESWDEAHARGAHGLAMVTAIWNADSPATAVRRALARAGGMKGTSPTPHEVA
ncbi:MAG: Nudix family hydrolase [Gammaproteobacteria bacterium]